MNLFTFRSVQDLTLSLARYLPGGKLFQSKDDPARNIYKLINGLAEEAFRVNSLLREYSAEYYPDNTTSFLEEWERALGIPDECFPVDGVSIVDRRRSVLLKLAGLNIQTADDFEGVALQFGVIVTVLGGKDAAVSPPITPDKTARFTIVVQFVPDTFFPYTFPILFGSDVESLLECIFKSAKPANCDLRFDAI